MRNRYARNILCVMAVLCAAAMTGCGTKTVKDSDVVMEIAGQPIVKAEYQMILASKENEVKRQYDTDTVNHSDFWRSEQDGAQPLDQIMQLAKDDLVNKKVTAQLAEDYGIQTKIDYLSIAAQMEQENEQRNRKEASGGAVYGLSSYDIGKYYDYIYTQAEYEVIEKLKQEQEISGEELEEIYRENVNQYTSDVSVKMLVAEMNAEVGMEKALQAAEAMKTETDADGLAEKCPDINFYEIEMSSLNMEEGRSGAYMQRWLIASAMQQDEICEPFAIGDNLMVMRCLTRSEAAAQPFEEVKGVLESDVRSGLAQEKFELRCQEAEVGLKVTEEQLEKIALEVLE